MQHRARAVTNLLEGIPHSWKNKFCREELFPQTQPAKRGRVGEQHLCPCLCPHWNRCRNQKTEGESPVLPRGGADVGTGCGMGWERGDFAGTASPSTLHPHPPSSILLPVPSPAPWGWGRLGRQGRVPALLPPPWGGIGSVKAIRTLGIHSRARDIFCHPGDAQGQAQCCLACRAGEALNGFFSIGSCPALRFEGGFRCLH